MKNIINCIVVDDEPLAIEQMEDFIGRIDFLKLKASFDNAFDAMNFIKTSSRTRSAMRLSVISPPENINRGTL